MKKMENMDIRSSGKTKYRTRQLIRRALSAAVAGSIGLAVVMPVMADSGPNPSGYDPNYSATTGDIAANDITTVSPNGGVQASNEHTLTISDSEVNGLVRATNGTVAITDSEINVTGIYGLVSAVNGGALILEGVTINARMPTSQEEEDWYNLNVLETQAVAIYGPASSATLTDVTINLIDGRNRGYQSSGLTVEKGEAVLENVRIDVEGDKTYGMWIQGAAGKIDATNTHITTNGVRSFGAQSFGADSLIILNGGSITTKGDNSAGIASMMGGEFRITGTSESPYTITTSGFGSVGVYIERSASASLEHTNVITTGEDAAAIQTGSGTNTVEVTGGNLISEQGDLIVVSGGTADITLTDVESTFAGSGNILNVLNGATGTLTTHNTELTGNIVGDSNSTAHLFLNDGSRFTGSFNAVNGSVVTEEGSVWEIPTGSSNVVAHFTPNGSVFAPLPSGAPSSGASTLEVTDTFHGVEGGQVGVNVWTGKNPTSDQINITGEYEGAPTKIRPNFVNGYHALPSSGVPVVIGDPGSFQEGDFYDPVKGGIYTYTGSFSNPNNDPQFSLYSSLNSAVVAANVLPVLGARTALATMPTLFDRQNHFGDESAGSTKGPWARIFGGSQKFESDNSARTGFNTSLWGAQAGYDVSAKTSDDGSRNYIGLYVGHGSASGDAKLKGRDVGRVELNATSVGAYWTKYSANNAYLNAVAQYSKLNGIKARGEGEEVKPGGSSLALSLEAGKQLNSEKSFIVEPQAQLIYQRTSINNSTLRANAFRPTATSLKLSNLSAATGRLGVLFQKNPNSGNNFLPWARLNLWHTFGGHSKIFSSDSDSLSTSTGGTSAEAQIGFVLARSQDSKWDVYGGAGYQFDLSGASYSGWKGNLGLRRNW